MLSSTHLGQVLTYSISNVTLYFVHVTLDFVHVTLDFSQHTPLVEISFG